MNKKIDLSTGIDAAFDEKLKKSIEAKINKINNNVKTPEDVERERLARLCLEIPDDEIDMSEDLSLKTISEDDRKEATKIAEAVILTKNEDNDQ